MSNPTTVTLAGVDVELQSPTSTSARWDVYSAATSNPNRAFAAALALCWRGKGKPRTRLAAHRYDALAFGGAVLDELTGRGVPLPTRLRSVARSSTSSPGAAYRSRR
jgi:hypothetical protein